MNTETAQRARPILFSAPMVRAILADRKSQTRRDVKFNVAGRIGRLSKQWHADDPGAVAARPYGKPGDRLWVREASIADSDYAADTQGVCYLADDTYVPFELTEEFNENDYNRYKWYRLNDPACDSVTVPSIHMPRWASRITLEITGIRLERLLDISEADAIAEGIVRLPLQEGEQGAWWTGDVSAGAALHARAPVDAYFKLWDSINGAGAHKANPLVWVVSFKRVQS